MNTLSDYEKDRERMNREVWSLIQGHAVVIDCGIGMNATSTRALLDKGSRVITIDNNIEALSAHKDIPVQLVQCDLKDIPFKPAAADAALFYFTLHEVDPLFHGHIISEMGGIVFSVYIVEPSPYGEGAYQWYEKLWTEAMHAVGKFEDYKPDFYWEDLLKKNGFRVTLSKQVIPEEVVPPEKIEEMYEITVTIWKEEGVPQTYFDEMKDFSEFAIKNGMKSSNILVVAGESKN